jgi:cytochrome c oxidase subunit 2
MSSEHATPTETPVHEEHDAAEFHVDRFESAWVKIAVLLLVVFGVAISISSFGYGVQIPSVYQRIDPRVFATPGMPDAGAFANPGLRELAPGQYEAYVLAQIWSFSPAEIRVPVGSRVTFYVTSRDVQHGFKLQDTNLNMMVLPGQVSTLSVTFDKPGTHNFICHEYCGSLHHTMYGRVVVEEVADSTAVQN